ncbi:MAG: UDP-N-acetylmuramoyl-tripeptide--D-alanyl-D-alanine ligase [Candidatus Anoxychlamydiales bacterium]|nr:UDP-N-acetylmuramoyl-tripeptide--D-alanyl-D-alanine ligase [Candidatus Anoxychlamydiales bacterium]
MDKDVEKVFNLKAAGYQIDSRLINKGDIFFALKGGQTDGHKYLKEVAKKGAIAAVVDSSYKIEEQSLDIQLIKVDEVLGFLQALAAENLKKYSAKIIALTGTSSKTTTKEFLHTLIASQFKVSKTNKSYNSKRGLPIAILNMDKNVDYLVLEMAMDKAKEIEKLVNIAPPDIAIVLQLATYVGDLGTIDNLAVAKKEIFSHKKTKIKLINKKLMSLNAFKDDNYLTFSIYDKTADFYLDISNEIFYEMEKKTTIKLPFKETHFLENLTAAISVCRILDIKYENIFKNFHLLKAYDLRFEKINLDGKIFIKDCYNGNPDATFAALKNLPKTSGRKIAVLGSQRCYGPLSAKVHVDIVKFAKKYVDEILCIGDEFENINNVKNFSDLESIANHLKKILKKDDVVLIKGSNSLKMEKIIDFIN